MNTHKTHSRKVRFESIPKYFTRGGGRGSYGLGGRGEDKGLHFSEDIIVIVDIEIVFAVKRRVVILKPLKVSLELIVQIEEIGSLLRGFPLVLLQIRPEKLARDAAGTRRRDEIGDYSSSTHGE